MVKKPASSARLGVVRDLLPGHVSRVPEHSMKVRELVGDFWMIRTCVIVKVCALCGAPDLRAFFCSQRSNSGVRLFASMSKSSGTRIFISYASKGGAQLAQRPQKSLTNEGFDSWLDTQPLIGGAIWTTEIEQAIDAVQVVLVGGKFLELDFNITLPAFLCCL